MKYFTKKLSKKKTNNNCFAKRKRLFSSPCQLPVHEALNALDSTLHMFLILGDITLIYKIPLFKSFYNYKNQ